MYCIQCGNPLSKKFIDGRARDYCLSCGWIYFHQLKVSSAVIIEQDQKILLLKRAYQPWQGDWYLPAGFVEADEDPRDAGKREVQEEIGINVEITNLFNHYYFNDDPRGNGLLLVYCSVINQLTFKPNNEILDFAFFPKNNLPGNLCGAGHKRAILEWAKNTYG